MADSVFWTSYADQSIRGAPLAGGGNVDTLYDLAQGVQGPVGVAIYAAAGRIYWANQGASIRGAPLAGGIVDTLTLPGPSLAGGVAIDTAGWLYWANESDDRIQRIPLAGGTIDVLYDAAQGVKDPGGVAVDPAAGRIYWANGGDNTIRGARLTGGGAVDTLYHAADGVKNPGGVAVDSAAGRIYWANGGDYTIRGARLTGGGAVDTLYSGSGQGVSLPVGVAIDPPTTARIISINRESWLYPLSGLLSPAMQIINWLISHGLRGRSGGGRIYWANNDDNTIRSAPLEGGGTVDTLYSGPGHGVDWPNYLAVLHAPLGAGAPAISGRGSLGLPLSCSHGDWAPDLLGSFLYRAPQHFTYQWTRNGSDISGATLATYTPYARGSYSCRVTATNQAGSTAQASGVAVI